MATLAIQQICFPATPMNRLVPGPKTLGELAGVSTRCFRDWLDPADAAIPSPGEPWREVFGMAPGLCGATTRAGVPCRQPGAGCGGRCKFHGGSSTGPRTAAGKARSSRNAKPPPSRTPVTMPPNPHLASPGPFVMPALPFEAALAPKAPTTAAAAIKQPSPHARRPFLDQLIDDHVAGRRRMPMVDRILAAVEAEPRAPTRLEIENCFGAMRLGPTIDRLISRGALAEVVQGRRVVLVRPRS